ncbi:MAG TPA: hypothetical protein VG253_19470 [Streptosporangiaceae bacterium]|nr:hypothetical protein [Streptosporangiaceae bacterium]
MSDSKESDVAVLTLDPRSSIARLSGAGVLAPRPSTLNGQTLGIVANGLGDSEFMFDALAVLLQDREGLAATVKVVKPSIAVPPYPEQWVEITDRATVAVTGFGGCGSCSTRSMRDALDLEMAGIPAVCVVHEALVPAVKAIAQFMGAGDYPVITVGYPHDPTAHWTKEEAVELAEQIVLAVTQRLTH